MAAALTLLLIGCLLQSVLGGWFEAFVPQTIEAVRGSCVTIPCSFDVEEAHKKNLDQTCRAMWKTGETVVFDSKYKEGNTITGDFTGDVQNKDCTTTLNNIQLEHSGEYYLRVECDNPLKWNFIFQKMKISVQDSPFRPTLTPSTLTVNEGDSVSLTCSAPAPCVTQPPALTWTPGLGEGRETLQETRDRTSVKSSVLTFTASHLHHGKRITCTASYSPHGGSTESSLTASVLFSPKDTKVSVSPSGPVPGDRTVTLTCSSSANPAVTTFTWYRADRNQETLIGTGQVLTIRASEVSGSFFCKAENKLGAGRSDISQIDVQFSPKDTKVSVSPSGPVPEDRTVTLTCSSSANPAVTTFTWYRADRDQETLIGTGGVLTIRASEVSGSFFCKAENELGAGRSDISQIDVQSAAQILFSSDCIKTAADQLNCSCNTVGNPPPTVQWYLDGSPVNHSDKFSISNESRLDSGLRSIITVNVPQWRNLSTLLCRSSNSLGSATRQFCVNSQTSAEIQDRAVPLMVFIITTVALIALVCALLFVIVIVIRFSTIRTNWTLIFETYQEMKPCTTSGNGKTHHDQPKTTAAMSQLLTSGEGNERQEDEAPHADISELEGANESPEKKNEEEGEVIYSNVDFKKKRQKEDAVNMDMEPCSSSPEESCMVGRMGKDFLNNALEMGQVFDEVRPRNKEVECEYAQVKFKSKREIQK